MPANSMTIARVLRSELSAHYGRVGAFQWGKVSAVNLGPPKTVDVYLDGTSALTTGLRYLNSYAPVVNDVVIIARMQGPAQTARVVLGKLA